eukprot:gene6633-biopygen5405
MFSVFGNSRSISANCLKQLEEYVCSLYRKGAKDINELRYDLFESMYEKKGTVQDLSILPPCRASLHIHAKRANYLAKLWKSNFCSTVEIENVEDHSWTEIGEIVWVKEAFPEDVEELLLSDENENDDDDRFYLIEDSDPYSDSNG